MPDRKLTSDHLRHRINQLWIMGDAGIMPDYRSLDDEDLWAEYQWVADLSWLPGDDGFAIPEGNHKARE